MKDKNLAAVLAFFGGFVGLHRFYLGQTGLGVLYVIMPGLNVMLGVLDAIIFLSMDQDTFDEKYNREEVSAFRSDKARRSGDRYERYRQRELNRRRRGSSVSRSKTTAAGRKQARKNNRRGVKQNRPDKRRSSASRTPANPDRELGLELFKDFDYDGAIEAFEKSLTIEPRDIATHWNLACAYSLTEDADKSLYHLDRAVAFGFNDFERLNSHDALAYLRVQPQFETFVKNEYRLAPDAPVPEAHQQDDLLSQAPPAANAAPRTNVDLLDQLQELGRLRERGLLSEAEFAAQKRKLLS
ncbi:hypothetical protein CEQ90_02820 [Lewinellaceae bacterium SD302]|nr:hypothetical protein CEQ90_02820 [Lewinellaceae bacterium SD302]